MSEALQVSEALKIAIFTAIVNGAVTWGVVSTKLAWMRRDIDDLQRWKETIQAELLRARTAEALQHK